MTSFRPIARERLCAHMKELLFDIEMRHFNFQDERGAMHDAWLHDGGAMV
jgi:hypothetical protein